MNAHAGIFTSCGGVHKRRQIFKLYVYQLANVFCRRAARRHAHCDRLPHVTDLFMRERMPRGGFVTWDGIGRDHGPDIREVIPHIYARFEVRRLGDRQNTRMSNRATNERDVALSRQHHVGHKVAASIKMAHVLLALDPASYALLHGGSCSCSARAVDVMPVCYFDGTCCE
jgi:hypothetical protein